MGLKKLNLHEEEHVLLMAICIVSPGVGSSSGELGDLGRGGREALSAAEGQQGDLEGGGAKGERETRKHPLCWVRTTHVKCVS